MASLGAALSFLFVGFAGCGDIGDPNYVPNTGTAVNQADLDSFPYCVGTCEPDYGSTRVDCRADDGLEFFPADVLNGDDGTITNFYSYNDNTAEFLHSGPGRYSTTQANFSPPAVTVNDLCGEADDTRVGTNRVHHLRGGLFREWGGGMGRRLVDFVTPLGCPAGPSREGMDPEYCPDADPRIEDAIAAGAPAALRGQFYGMMADLRGWEGISFWARGGPNNTAGIRVYLADRQLDDDIAFLENNAGITPMCGRVRECGCRNHRPCTPGPAPLIDSYCFDPAETPDFFELRQQYFARGEQVLFEERFPFCDASACNDINDAFQAVDPLFATPTASIPGTAECQAYKLTNDLEDYFCFDRNKPESLPPDGPDRCGDGWAKGVALTNDWQFYKVPFTELRQEGYGKEFQYLDLSKITLVRFTWMQGWLDVWLDDVRFYRQADAPPASE